ncbi:MAG TPA: hypothetical protein PLU55_01510 [Candidatus Pacearchaeota archaeon]|nr:hypothetical protein [Candidatus Pacearchaeota archaeon]
MTTNNLSHIELKIGDKFRDKNYLYHVVEIIEDGEEAIIVYKYFGKHKRWWHYLVKSKRDINIWFEAGLLRKENKKH